MPRLFNRPRGMDRLFQGRMFNRLTGQRAPRLYSGRRPQRASNRFFGTQVSPYGAGGGGQGQSMISHAGGGAWGAMLNQSRRGGTNLGMRHHTPGYRGTRMAASFRKEQAGIKRDYRSKIREQKSRIQRFTGPNMHGVVPKNKANEARAKLAQLRGQHRVDRRSAAASWSNKNRGASPRFGINVRQNPYTGRRFNTRFRFRRQQGSQQAHLDRAQKRNMRIANRWRRGDGRDMRLHGGQRKTGPQYGLPATHADFTRGGRLSGRIRAGEWNPNVRYYYTEGGKRKSFSYTDWRTPEHNASTAREWIRRGGRFAPYRDQVPYHAFKESRDWSRPISINRMDKFSRPNDRTPMGGMGGGSMFSDSRLKTDIEPMGKSPSGINIYQFRYVGGGPLYQGVIAQELLETHPNAVVTMPNGYYGVRYDLIDVDFVKVSEKELALNA